MQQTPASTSKAFTATGLSVGMSILLIVLGLTAVLLPNAVSIAVSILILWVIVFTGLAHLVHAWDARGNPLFAWRLLVGLLYMVGGVFLLLYPGYDLAFLTLFIAGMLALEALLLFGAYAWLRQIPGTGWIGVDGAFTTLLALVVALTWPHTPLWLLATCVGLNIISTGATRLMLSRGKGGPLEDLLP